MTELKKFSGPAVGTEDFTRFVNLRWEEIRGRSLCHMLISETVTADISISDLPHEIQFDVQAAIDSGDAGRLDDIMAEADAQIDRVAEERQQARPVFACLQIPMLVDAAGGIVDSNIDGFVHIAISYWKPREEMMKVVAVRRSDRRVRFSFTGPPSYTPREEPDESPPAYPPREAQK